MACFAPRKFLPLKPWGSFALSRPFDDLALFLRDAVKLVHQVIDFGVGGGDVPLRRVFLVG
jgi:hypothetical protein